jgi:hypothetical protein
MGFLFLFMVQNVPVHTPVPHLVHVMLAKYIIKWFRESQVRRVSACTVCTLLYITPLALALRCRFINEGYTLISISDSCDKRRRGRVFRYSDGWCITVSHKWRCELLLAMNILCIVRCWFHFSLFHSIHERYL